MSNEQHVRDIFQLDGKSYYFSPLDHLAAGDPSRLAKLPFSIRILLEGALRQKELGKAGDKDIENILNWQPQADSRPIIPVFPGRVILQDFTGVPVLNDLAAMRTALVRAGGNPESINPVVPVDLVIDHSVQVDYAGSANSYRLNAEIEFKRNKERYQFLHWAQNVFANLRVVPPASGIVHQVNLEYLATGVLTREIDGQTWLYPDTLVGTDSHTTMINGLGVVGWGVGGIEAVAAMLAEPIEIVAPDVIGVRLNGKLPEGVTPTDLTLTVIQMLRKTGVVDKFVEFFGPGLDNLSLADRAMIANMTPESGATMLYFPVDDQTIKYLRLSGRKEELVRLVEAYYRRQGLFRTAETSEPQFTTTIAVDLGSIEPSLAGPKRPQDRVSLREMKANFKNALVTPRSQNGFGISTEALGTTTVVQTDHSPSELTHGSIVIAAITSCTNTSNPFVMLSAGLLAKKAVEKGLKKHPYVKTSLAPGSRVVTDYLQEAGLMDSLEELGFNLVGYGCTTCIGNSGPLPENIVSAIKDNNLVVGAVLSGNRNFEGRVSPFTRANYLASPPMVVAYSLAGTLDIDLNQDPLGIGKDDQPVYLKDIWPTSAEVQELIAEFISPDMYRDGYASLFDMSIEWKAIKSGHSPLYEWAEESTYLQEPPFFPQGAKPGKNAGDVRQARVLALLGDSITTDHISPAGTIAVNSPAGEYLISQGVKPSEFNSYGSRRGNDRIMTRGTFANIRLKNQLVPGIEGGYTRHFPDGQQTTIFEAAQKYQQEGVPLVVIAGKEYGTGSSRDWAAKGVLLLGVRAVIAESFERIHRSNLAGMGILPLQFKPGENAASLGLTGEETLDILNVADRLTPGAEIQVHATHPDGKATTFTVSLRLNTPNEISYYKNGGIMPTILFHLA